MKTPKRYPATMSVYLTRQDLKNDRARWKRKNREAQLKRTISRLTEELEEAQQKAENISYSSMELMKSVSRQLRQLHIAGSLSPHFVLRSENPAIRPTTSANTY